jgi:hypothetical protein
MRGVVVVVGGVMSVDVDEQMRWMWMKMRWMLTASFKLREGDEGLYLGCWRW